MPTKHPLGLAIDAGRWDAEAPLGRVVLVAHAAFLDAGFVSCGKPAGPHQLPREAGLTASTLSLRYTIPELLIMRPRNAADAAVLRLCAHGSFLILYAYLTGDGSRPISTRWACVDALLVAPVLAGDLDAAAHALANHALGVRLWAALAGGMCRLLFDDIYRKNGVLLPPRFMLLPADLKAAILNRVAAVDLAMVECTCTELRDLVAGRELWRAKYMAERRFLLLSEQSQVDGWSCSWKEMYLRARQSWAWRRPGSRHRLRPSWWFMDDVLLSRRYAFTDSFRLYVDGRDLDRCKRQDPTEHLIRRVRERSNVPVSDGRRKPPVGDGDAGKIQCSHGVIYSPSARYKWRHR